MRLRILSIIPYHFYPPMNGGSLRCYYILKEMAKENDVFLLTVQPRSDFKKQSVFEFSAEVQILSIADSKEYRSFFNFLPPKIASAINYKILKPTIKESTNHYFLKAYPLIFSLLKNEKINMVYYENLEPMNLFQKKIKSKFPDLKQVMDAHNVDSLLWQQMAGGDKSSIYASYAKAAFHIEKNLYKTVDHIFCCSTTDMEIFKKMNEKVINTTVIPNGVDTETKPFDANPLKMTIKNLLFCGSLGYQPNREGLLWFYDKVFPLVRASHSDIRLVVVGAVSNTDPYRELINDSAVDFIGSVDSVVPYYVKSSVAIVPLLHGSGTRLKILEAMSMGNPVVSTSIGAEGLNLSHQFHIKIADDATSFATAINSLFAQQQDAMQMRKNANDFVKQHFDWKIIGTIINQRLKDIVCS